eukprot:CFRG3489T1
MPKVIVTCLISGTLAMDIMEYQPSVHGTPVYNIPYSSVEYQTSQPSDPTSVVTTTADITHTVKVPTEYDEQEECYASITLTLERDLKYLHSDSLHVFQTYITSCIESWDISSAVDEGCDIDNSVMLTDVYKTDSRWDGYSVLSTNQCKLRSTNMLINICTESCYKAFTKCVQSNDLQVNLNRPFPKIYDLPAFSSETGIHGHPAIPPIPSPAGIRPDASEIPNCKFVSLWLNPDTGKSEWICGLCERGYYTEKLACIKATDQQCDGSNNGCSDDNAIPYCAYEDFSTIGTFTGEVIQACLLKDCCSEGQTSSNGVHALATCPACEITTEEVVEVFSCPIQPTRTPVHATPSPSVDGSAFPTASAMPSFSASSLPSPTRSASVSASPCPTETPTSIPSPTPSPSVTSSPCPTETPTSIPYATSSASVSTSPGPTETPTPSPSVTSSPCPTETPTSIPYATSSASVSTSPGPTETPTSSPSVTSSPCPTETPTSTLDVTPSASVSSSPCPTETPTSTPYVVPSASVSSSPRPTETPIPSPSVSSSPCPTETPTSTLYVTPSASVSSSPCPTETPTPSPSLSSSPCPTLSPTPTTSAKAVCSSTRKVDFESAPTEGHPLMLQDNEPVLPSYNFEGLKFSLVKRHSFTKVNLTPFVECVGSDDEDPQGFISTCGSDSYDTDRSGTLGQYFMRLGGYKKVMRYWPSLLITVDDVEAKKVAGMIYDIDGFTLLHAEQYRVTAFDSNKTQLVSQNSPKGKGILCRKNVYESAPWEFLMDSPTPIKYVRIDYIGVGTPRFTGLAFDNFRIICD